MDETMAVTMDACWVGQKAESTDTLWAGSMDATWVGQMDASTAGHSVVRSAVCSVALLDMMWVG